MKDYTILFAVVIGLLFYGCDDVFEFSPYQANVKSEDKSQTLKSYEALDNIDIQENDTVYIALIADSHYFYYELEQAVEKVNSLNVDFVAHLGDFTDKGLLKEYEFYKKYISELEKPVFTCIGNHDYLSNGGKIYRQMFGEFNYSLYYRGIKFIFFDATTFESGKNPDLNWLENELNDSIPKVFLSHVPPWDDQYKEADTDRFYNMTAGKNIIISLHGHHHSHKVVQQPNSELNFIVAGSVEKGYICLLKLFGESKYSFELIAI